MRKAKRLQLSCGIFTELDGFLQGYSHQIMGTRSGVYIRKQPSLPMLFLPVSVQTSTLSALSGSQTAEVWDPLPDLPIALPEEFY